jgi:hypothetical protein
MPIMKYLHILFRWRDTSQDLSQGFAIRGMLPARLCFHPPKIHDNDFLLHEKGSEFC